MLFRSSVFVHISTAAQNLNCAPSIKVATAEMNRSSRNKPKPSQTQGSWTHRCSVDWMVALGLHFHNTAPKEPDLALACFYVASVNGAYIPRLLQMEIVAVETMNKPTFPPSIESQVRRLCLTKALSRGTLPVDWLEPQDLKQLPRFAGEQTEV